MAVIKVLLKNNEIIKLELGDDKKEIELVTRFHRGLAGNTVLNLKISNKSVSTRIMVADIKNMQCLKNGSDDFVHSIEGSRFKTREEYEQWKEQKIKENEFKLSQKTEEIKRTS
jgi:hypothetical protein